MYYCVICISLYYVFLSCFFFFKQKTAYEMRISDWSSDVCSSDLDTTSKVSESDSRLVTAASFSRPGYSAKIADWSGLATWLSSATAPSERSSFISLQIGRASCRERVCQYV